MSPTAQFWLLIVLLGAGTWAMRSFPILLHGHVPHPPWLERLLKYVPVAALTALVVPASLYLKANGAYHAVPARTIAAVVALVVAVRTKNTIATLVSGMVVLWVAQWAIGLL
jgi:branched-subunit amino acid transport protein